VEKTLGNTFNGTTLYQDTLAVLIRTRMGLSCVAIAILKYTILCMVMKNTQTSLKEFSPTKNKIAPNGAVFLI
jgi:hypothetical protein